MEKLNFESSLYLQIFTLSSICVYTIQLHNLLPHRKRDGIVSGNQHVTFAFPQSPGIYYQNNKRYIGSFYILKIYMTKNFF